MRIFLLALILCSPAIGQTLPHAGDTLIFQTGNVWSLRVNVEAGTVMTYRIHKDLPDRIRSWKEHGYRVAVGSVVKQLSSAPPSLSHRAPAPTVLRGRSIDLFDSHVRVVENPQVARGERRLLLDPSFFHATRARVIAASTKVLDERAAANTLHFAVTNIEARDDQDLTAIRLLLPRAAKSVMVDGKPLADAKADAGGMLIEFPARAALQHVDVV